MIRLETKYTKRIISDNGLNSLYQRRINRIVKRLKKKTALGVEMTG
ncbi:MAG: hypothetical protein MJ200_00610 [Mycoplasmoidaceae bacterium]|nr:hypothetical protein [Mycoplasmoidaceae bacterium]